MPKEKKTFDLYLAEDTIDKLIKDIKEGAKEILGFYQGIEEEEHSLPKFASISEEVGVDMLQEIKEFKENQVLLDYLKQWDIETIDFSFQFSSMAGIEHYTAAGNSLKLNCTVEIHGDSFLEVPFEDLLVDLVLMVREQGK